MPVYLPVIVRLLIILLIGIMSYLILTKIITWPERSKAKRTGQIMEKDDEADTQVVKIYLFIWIFLVVAGFLVIKFLL